MSVFSVLVGYYRQVLDATKEFFIRVLMSILIFLGYVLLSLFIYAVMRRIMVPQKLHVIPVHLQYNSRCLRQSPSMHNDLSACPFPQADFLLNDGQKLLSSGQSYRIALEMEVPENQVNLEAGLFMVNITFYSTNKKFLSTSARPAAVRYRSPLLRILYTVVFSLPLLLGFWEQKQSLELVLFENYYEPYGDGALSAKIFLESNEVHIYSTSLTIDADFSGFTYYLYQWPLSMSIIVVISILITLCTCTVLLWIRDVLHDYEEQRAARMQRRRGLMQQGGGARGEATREHRRMRQFRPHRSAETVGVASTTTTAVPGGDSTSPPPPPPPPLPPAHPSRTATHFEEDQNDTDDRTEGQSSGSATPTDESSVPQDMPTGSEMSTGLSDVINNLRALRQDIDDESSSDISSLGGGEELATSRRRQGWGEGSVRGEGASLPLAPEDEGAPVPSERETLRRRS